MGIAQYINVVFAIIVWAAVFLLMKPQRIKALLPIGLLAAIVLFGAEMYFLSLGLHKYNNPFLPIAGIPLFHLTWSAGSGIIFAHFLKKEFSKKLVIIFIFTVLTMLFGYISDTVGNHTNMGSFNDVYHFILDFFILGVLAWVAEGIFKERIYSNP